MMQEMNERRAEERKIGKEEKEVVIWKEERGKEGERKQLEKPSFPDLRQRTTAKCVGKPNYCVTVD